jgi:transposase
MNRENVMKWCREFSERRTDVHDEQRRGKPSLISDDLLQETEGEIRANRRVTVRELRHIIPEVSKTTIHGAGLAFWTCVPLFRWTPEDATPVIYLTVRFCS